MSPEYALRGTFSEKSDVYSFGVLLLEIVSGKKNSSFYDEDQQMFLTAYVSCPDPDKLKPFFSCFIIRSFLLVLIRAGLENVERRKHSEFGGSGNV